MRRIIIVYNPRSSKFGKIKDEILDRTYFLSGWTVAKYEVMPTNVQDNIKKLAKIIIDGDLVLSVGGDGTATISLNAIIVSKKKAELGVTKFGNFNDFAKALGTKTLMDVIRGKTVDFWPLEVKINDKHWRYVPCYFTAGLFAESTAVFDQEDIRKKLQKKKKRKALSIKNLAKWYFKNCRNDFLPDGKLNGKKFAKITDYLAINTQSVASLMHNKKYQYDYKRFWSSIPDLKKHMNLYKFMSKSILKQIPGKVSEGDLLEFTHPTQIMVQSEGEYEKISNVKKIEIKKCTSPVEAITLSR